MEATPGLRYCVLQAACANPNDDQGVFQMLRNGNSGPRPTDDDSTQRLTRSMIPAVGQAKEATYTFNEGSQMHEVTNFTAPKGMYFIYIGDVGL